jgi:hypothetical protein
VDAADQRGELHAGVARRHLQTRIDVEKAVEYRSFNHEALKAALAWLDGHQLDDLMAADAPATAVLPAGGALALNR